MKFKVLVLVCAILMASPLALAKKHHQKPQSGGTFDYYLLSLSWAPNYCASHPSDHSKECTTRSTFVLHGLWPQANSGPPPMNCPGSDSVSPNTVDHMLQFMPSRGLIRHEWTKHGTCSGLSADGYFKAVEEAFTSVKVPDTYKNLSHEGSVDIDELEQNFAAANRAPRDAFRTSCHTGELVGVEICLDKDLNYRACSRSVRECSSSSVTVRAPQP